MKRTSRFSNPVIQMPTLSVPYVTARGFVAQMQRGIVPPVLKQAQDGAFIVTPNVKGHDNWFASVRKSSGKYEIMGMIK